MFLDFNRSDKAINNKRLLNKRKSNSLDRTHLFNK